MIIIGLWLDPLRREGRVWGVLTAWELLLLVGWWSEPKSRDLLPSSSAHAAHQHDMLSLHQIPRTRTDPKHLAAQPALEDETPVA